MKILFLMTEMILCLLIEDIFKFPKRDILTTGACINGVFTREDADSSAAPDADLPPETERSYPIAALLNAVVQKADVEALFKKHETDSFFHIFMVMHRWFLAADV